MTAKITYQQLEAAGACTPQLLRFRERYGDEVAVTVEAAREAADLFDWRWAAMNLLEPAARQAYYAARDSAWKACIAAKDLIWAAYYAACAEAFARLYIEQEDAR